MKTIAERLKWAREQAGYKTTAEGANALKMPYPTYASHENGSRVPQRDTAVRYANRFKVTADWLLTGRGDPKAGFKSELDDLPPDARAEALSYLNYLRQRYGVN